MHNNKLNETTRVELIKDDNGKNTYYILDSVYKVGERCNFTYSRKLLYKKSG